MQTVLVMDDGDAVDMSILCSFLTIIKNLKILYMKINLIKLSKVHA